MRAAPASGTGEDPAGAVPTSFQLPNGLTVLLSERPGLPIVSASLVFKSGSDSNPADKPGLANFTATMLDEGTATRPALQIADEVAYLGGSLNTSSTMDSTQIAASSLRRNFQSLLELVADVARHPSFPAEEIDRQRASRLASRAAARIRHKWLTLRRGGAYGPNHLTAT